MTWLPLLARLLLVAVFVVAAVAKLADRKGSSQAVADFGLPNRMAAPLALLLPLIELAIAALLIPGGTARWGALAALGLLGLFTAVIVASLARGRKPNCHCFGQLHSAPVGWTTVARNGFLAALAGLVLWRGEVSPDFSSLTANAGFSAAAWLALGVALLALGLGATQVWLVLNLLPQQGRILARLEEVEAALGVGPGTGLRVGRQAPEFELPGLTGERVNLAALRSSGQPTLLFFTNPDCAPCDAVLPDIARWQREHADRVSIAVISHGSIEVNRGKAEQHGLRTVLLQKDREVKEAYQVEGTPAAVLVGADGRIASRMGYGGEDIEGLLRQALDGVVSPPLELMPKYSDGHEPPVPPAPPIGELAPALVLPNLAGEPTNLAELQGQAVLILFWSPDCGFCQRMLPELKAWERKTSPRSPQLLVVSSGTVEANRAMGLASPVVLDAEGSVMSAFGASGTPMAVLVDADSRIASSLVAGEQEVMALARTRQKQPAREYRV
jgi:methylamine dehydrogenase accessory protein MauD